MIADAEVFGWAFHYIQEDIKAPEKKEPAKVSFTPPTPKAEVPKPAPAPVVKPKKVKEEGMMMSLFNFDEE